MYAKNREEWAFTDFACIQANITTVPLYDTIGKTSIEYIIDQSQIATLACSQDKIENLVKLKKGNKIQSLKYIICFDKCDDSTQEE